MNKLILIIGCFIIGLLIGATFIALDHGGTSVVASEAAANPVLSAVETTDPVVAQAKVVPVHSVELSFPSNGVVAEMFVQEGDTVKKGTPLARMDTRDLQLGVEEAQAALAHASANYDQLRAEASVAKLPAAANAAAAGATAQLRQAEIALKRAELALDQATLRAPMDGTIVEVNLRVGEVLSATAPDIVLADFSTWQFLTDNLTDLGVVRIREGDPAAITFEALPDLKLPGKVTHIKAIGKDNSGNTTYTVTITPGQQDDRLRWNMTASVTITPSK